MSDRDATPINTSKELVAVAIRALRRNGYGISAEAIEEFTREYDSLAAKLAEAERERDEARLAKGGPYGHALEEGANAQRQVIAQLRADLTAAQATITQLRAESDAVKAAVEAEREACAKIADTGMLVPPDGGSPTDGECDVALGIAAAIRSRSSAPPVPAPNDGAV